MVPLGKSHGLFLRLQACKYLRYHFPCSKVLRVSSFLLCQPGSEYSQAPSTARPRQPQAPQLPAHPFLCSVHLSVTLCPQVPNPAPAQADASSGPGPATFLCIPDRVMPLRGSVPSSEEWDAEMPGSVGAKGSGHRGGPSVNVVVWNGPLGHRFWGNFWHKHLMRERYSVHSAEGACPPVSGSH